MLNPLFWFVPFGSILALIFAWIFFKQMMKKSEGTETMASIAADVRQGAMAYLRQQYKIVIMVFLILTGIFAVLAYVLHVQNPWVPFAFLTGGIFSGLAGFFGMKTATYASARTAYAAQKSLNSGLQVAFRSGAVMGLVVVGLGLLDISLWFLVLTAVYPAGAAEGHNLMIITTTMLTFGMGASTQALFARVGGGIFTKAADVGADLVGKVEAGIPEDDPRNPATIADNVGDNVGDVAGMGADLYESYCGSILATAALGAAACMGDPVLQFKAVIAPMLIASVGIVLSILGIFLVRTREDATQKTLLSALGRGINVSSFLIVVFSLGILKLLNIPNAFGLWGSIVTGLLVGIGIGKVTEYYTSHSFRPTQTIAENTKTGPATVIIAGLGTGMMSTAFPVLFVVTGTMLSYVFASGFRFENMGMGLYGIGIAAVGMLSTLGITLATDAYGPVADNAGGIAEQAHLDPEVRERTDALDSLGNTTAATGKGFAIGSAALAALGMTAAFAETMKVQGFDISISLTDPIVIVGLFIGAMMVFIFSALTMEAVGKAAMGIVNEVRRQWREIPGLMDGTAKPDYATCVSISTASSLKAMILPGLLAVITPILVGLVLGANALGGMLIGAISAGFMMAVTMANAGGAWDNAKKWIETGQLGGKGSDAHKAAVVGDTVGDPFKDTSGPSLNILLKLMSIVAVVFAPIFTLTGWIG